MSAQVEEPIVPPYVSSLPLPKMPLPPRVPPLKLPSPAPAPPPPADAKGSLLSLGPYQPPAPPPLSTDTKHCGFVGPKGGLCDKTSLGTNSMCKKHGGTWEPKDLPAMRPVAAPRPQAERPAGAPAESSVSPRSEVDDSDDIHARIASSLIPVDGARPSVSLKSQKEKLAKVKLVKEVQKNHPESADYILGSEALEGSGEDPADAADSIGQEIADLAKEAAQHEAGKVVFKIGHDMVFCPMVEIVAIMARPKLADKLAGSAKRLRENEGVQVTLDHMLDTDLRETVKLAKPWMAYMGAMAGVLIDSVYKADVEEKLKAAPGLREKEKLDKEKAASIAAKYPGT